MSWSGMGLSGLLEVVGVNGRLSGDVGAWFEGLSRLLGLSELIESCRELSGSGSGSYLYFWGCREMSGLGSGVVWGAGIVRIKRAVGSCRDLVRGAVCASGAVGSRRGYGSAVCLCL